MPALLCVRMCVKSLVDKAVIEPVSDDDENLHNFCTVMEHIMLHRYEGKGSVLVLCDSTCHVSVWVCECGCMSVWVYECGCMSVWVCGYMHVFVCMCV